MQQNQTYRIARVTANQNLALSSTTLQNVTQLLASVLASGIYKVKLSLYVKGKADSDVKVTLVGPSGATGVIDLQSVSPKVNPIGTAIAVSLSDDTLSLIEMEGVVTISTTAGNLQVQAAQNTSQADQLTVEAGSCLEVWTISDTS